MAKKAVCPKCASSEIALKEIGKSYHHVCNGCGWRPKGKNTSFVEIEIPDDPQDETRKSLLDYSIDEIIEMPFASTGIIIIFAVIVSLFVTKDYNGWFFYIFLIGVTLIGFDLGKGKGLLEH